MFSKLVLLGACHSGVGLKSQGVGAMWVFNPSLPKEKLRVLVPPLTLGPALRVVFMVRLCPSPSYLLCHGLSLMVQCVGGAKPVFRLFFSEGSCSMCSCRLYMGGELRIEPDHPRQFRLAFIFRKERNRSPAAAVPRPRAQALGLAL